MPTTYAAQPGERFSSVNTRRGEIGFLSLRRPIFTSNWDNIKPHSSLEIRNEVNKKKNLFENVVGDPEFIDQTARVTTGATNTPKHFSGLIVKQIVSSI